jgi:hypothetical protein
MRYLDALDAGDLEAVAALWEGASHDPELERRLAELDGAMLEEILGNAGARPERRGRRRPRWAVWGGAVGTMAAAGLLAILAGPRRETHGPGSNPPLRPTAEVVAHQPSADSQGPTPLLRSRRDLDEAALPRFVWPLENLLSASTPLDLLD